MAGSGRRMAEVFGKYFRPQFDQLDPLIDIRIYVAGDPTAMASALNLQGPFTRPLPDHPLIAPWIVHDLRRTEGADVVIGPLTIAFSYPSWPCRWSSGPRPLRPSRPITLRTIQSSSSSVTSPSERVFTFCRTLPTVSHSIPRIEKMTSCH